MKVLAHPDPFVLEAELLEGIASAQREDPLARVLVIVPTSRLAFHVGRRVAERHGARLGVEILVHRTLAYRILEEAGVAAPEVASPVLLEELLRRVLAERAGGELCRLASSRPGTLGSLLETVKDLREAGITPEALRAETTSALDRELADLYADYCRGLERLATAGTVDEAGLVAAALPHAERFARHRAAIFHHGAYELIGAHLDLVRALDAASPVTFLLSAGEGAGATAYARDYARRHLVGGDGGGIGWLVGREGGLLGPRLLALYDEEAEPPRLPAATYSFRDAQGARAELTTAFRSALRAVAGGTPPQEIAIVARDLGPYSSALDAILEEEALPCSTSLRVPLRRDPGIRDLLLLLSAAAEGFPRAKTAQWLQSRALRLARLAGGPVPGELAEDWSRRAGLLGGLDGWTRQLPGWAAAVRFHEDATEEERAAAEDRSRRRLERAARIASAVARAAGRLEPERPRRWSEHASVVRSLAEDLLRDGAEPRPPHRALLDLVDTMERIETALGDGRPVPFAEMTEWLERAVDRTDLPCEEDDLGGVRVLDAMQARGLTYEVLLLVGMQSGVFPRRPREDPFLRDRTRRRLREATGRPLPVKEDGLLEERQILALLLGSARCRLEISRQRADESGKALSPSVALREVARVLAGRADLEALRSAGGSLPVHPRSRLETLEEWFGMLSEQEARLLRALRAAGREGAELSRRHPELAPGVEMLRATESFAPGDVRYDARVGTRLPPGEPISVTGLETLGRCPLQYFFEHGLGIRALEEAPSPFAVDRGEMGTLVHDFLAKLYPRLHEEGLFGKGRRAELIERARRIFPDLWAEATAAVRERLGPAAPFLWRLELERWQRALLAFVEEDLGRLSDTGAVPEGFEVPREAALDLGRGRPIVVRGRFDRIVRQEGQVVVSDYKTSPKLRTMASTSDMLKGQTLQAPLYRLLAGGAPVELLGVGPDNDPADVRSELRRVTFDGFDRSDHEAGFRETLDVLVGLARAGGFPFNKGRHCGRCAYDRACRRNHPPAAHRNLHAPDTEQYRLVLKKNTREPTIGRVRERLAREGAE